MNLAFQAVVIVLLILPGVIFRKYSSPVGHFRARRPIAEEIAESLVAAGVAHLVWVPLANLIGSVWGLSVNVWAALVLVAGRLGHAADSLDALEAASDCSWQVFLYFATLYSACIGAGQLWKRLLLRWQGQRNAILRFAPSDEHQGRRFAQWSQVLSVEIGKGETLQTIVVASLTLGSKTYLYAGVLELEDVLWNYQTGEPDWLVLSSPMRRDITDDVDAQAEGSERWYEIEGDSFMLRYPKLDSLNLIFISMPDEDIEEEPLSVEQQPLVTDEPSPGE